jgi:hypothetical protein
MLALAAILVAGTLLILVGCRLVKAANPGVLRAAWVNLTGVGAVCFANVLIGALLIPVHAAIRSNAADPESTILLVTRVLQIPADIAILALTYSLLLDKLPYWRAVVVSMMVAAGLAVVLFLTTYAVSVMMPQAPRVPEDQLRESAHGNLTSVRVA